MTLISFLKRDRETKHCLFANKHLKECNNSWSGPTHEHKVLIVEEGNANDSGTRNPGQRICSNVHVECFYQSKGPIWNEYKLGLCNLPIYYLHKKKSLPPIALCSFINHSSTVASGKIGTKLGLKNEQDIQDLTIWKKPLHTFSQTCFHRANTVLAINSVHQVYRSRKDATRKIATLERPTL